MSKYFMRDTHLFAFEAMMMERPRSYRDYGAEEQQRPRKRFAPPRTGRRKLAALPTVTPEVSNEKATM